MPNDITSSGEAESSLSLSKPVTEVRLEDSCQEGTSLAVSTKTLELHLSTDALENLLKDGKLERQSDELYQVMEEASKEIEQTLDIEALKEEDKETSSSQNSQLNDSAVTPVVIKRKRGRPRKETYLSKITTCTAQSSVHGSQSRKVRGKNLTSPVQFESIEDQVEDDTDTDVKPKRSRKTKILHDDYVADFNTSDEEEGGKIFRRLSGRGRGRGRGKRKNCEFPEAFNDFFSSCNEFFGKKSMLGEECVEHSILEDLGECGDEEEQNLPCESSSKCKHEVKDGMEGVIGPGGQTRVQIVNTGDTTVIDNEENFIYNIITTTGERESITPIVIPKVAGDVLSKGLDEGPPLPSVKPDVDDEGTVDSIVQGQGTESQATSKDTQSKQQQKDRALYKQVASLKQKYYQALQELKKKPQVSTFADLVYGAASFLTDEQLMFFTMQLKSGCPNMPGVKYSVREKMLALAFYLQSPDLYKWLSLIFHLPSKVILERWLDGVTRNNPEDAKKLVYNVYTRYIFRP